MAERLQLTESESIVIRSSSPELLDGEASYGPGGKPPPLHLHPDLDERFEVIEGGLTARVGDSTRHLGPGDVFEVPRGTPHQLWNPHPSPARVIWQTRPRGRMEDWFRDVDALHRRSATRPGPLAFAPLLSRYRDTFRLAIAPDPLVRVPLELLALVGRLRGH